MASASDQDRDGRADVLIGAPGSDAGGEDSGRAFVYSGRRHTLLRKLDAGRAGAAFGAGTDWTPDATGDGVPDLIVGAGAGGPLGNGAVHLFSGASGRERWGAFAPPSGRTLGTFFVAGVGDVDGDGVPDVYAADYADRSLGPGTGRSALYSGADGHELHSFTGAAAGAGLGPGREAGDLDGDGRNELAIGSTGRAPVRRRPGSSSSTRPPARCCARSRARARGRTSASTWSASATSTATRSATSSCPQPRATRCT